jgi:UrcA family protein
MIKTLTAAAALAALFATAPAVAGQHKTVSVSYSDLDLTHEHGRARLDSRVNIAARQVCGFENATELARKTAERRCFSKALADSRPAVELAHRSAAGQRLASATVMVAGQ